MKKAMELTKYCFKETTTSATTLTSQTSASRTTSESSSTSAGSEAHGSSTNKGAIAGGVVGGVCGALLIIGLIWFFLRRRRSSSAKKHEVSEYTGSQPSGYSSPPGYRSATQGELYGTAASHEVPGDMPIAQELPSDKYESKSPSELS
jgi:hypothetical protein